MINSRALVRREITRDSTIIIEIRMTEVMVKSATYLLHNGKSHCTACLQFDWFRISSFTTLNINLVSDAGIRIHDLII